MVRLGNLASYVQISHETIFMLRNTLLRSNCAAIMGLSMKFISVSVIGLAVLFVFIVSLYASRILKPAPNPGPQTSGQIEAPIAKIIEKMPSDGFYQQDFFLIDNSLIFVKRLSYISDYNYHHLLLDEQGAELCSVAGSIAGPRMQCNDATKKDLFQTIIKHMDDHDLGLTGHTVKLIYQK